MTSPDTMAAPATPGDRKVDRRQYRVHCPHCRAIAIVRSSFAITDEVRQLTLACTNSACGHIFGATAEVRVTLSHTIAPSAIPNPAVELLITAPRMRRDAFRPARAGGGKRRAPRPANDTIPARDAPPCGPEVPPANDDAATEHALG